MAQRQRVGFQSQRLRVQIPLGSHFFFSLLFFLSAPPGWLAGCRDLESLWVCSAFSAPPGHGWLVASASNPSGFAVFFLPPLVGRLPRPQIPLGSQCFSAPAQAGVETGRFSNLIACGVICVAMTALRPRGGLVASASDPSGFMFTVAGGTPPSLLVP